MLTTSGAPTVQNIVLPIKHVEITIQVPAHVKKIMIQVREFKEVQIAFDVGQAGTNYFTLKSGCTYYEDNVQGPFVMAIQGVEDNTTIEYVTWHHWN